MAVDLSTFRAFIPEFASKTDEVLNLFLNQAALRVSIDSLGVHYDAGLMYMTAHMLTVAGQGGAAAGGVRGETVGSLNRQYGGASLTSRTNLDTTAYGKELLNLMRLNCSGGYAIGAAQDSAGY